MPLDSNYRSYLDRRWQNDREQWEKDFYRDRERERQREQQQHQTNLVNRRLYPYIPISSKEDASLPLFYYELARHYLPSFAYMLLGALTVSTFMGNQWNAAKETIWESAYKHFYYPVITVSYELLALANFVLPIGIVCWKNLLVEYQEKHPREEPENCPKLICGAITTLSAASALITVASVISGIAGVILNFALVTKSDCSDSALERLESFLINKGGIFHLTSIFAGILAIGATAACYGIVSCKVCCCGEKSQGNGTQSLR